ncbi:alpha-amylase family glycosyl hydrolase [Psychromonas sp. KJ10-10]|uniref:alpha-amylase family glycosyl hydrolase n=1 Tax=Psychromonas sp. KJ10-10 TaxID=3391823 RepID=UPI0039B6516E
MNKCNLKYKLLHKKYLAPIATLFLSACMSIDVADTSDSKESMIPYACNASITSKVDDLRMYQVMVESFVNGDENIGYGTGYGTSHHQGDLQGIIDSLEYIQSLGVNAIWLTPIFDSVPIAGQDHWADRLDATGYYASNYFAIDPRFGTMEKAKELVDEAHKRGLYVFFDGVFGHHKDNIVASPQGNLPQGKVTRLAIQKVWHFIKKWQLIGLQS